MQFFGFFFFLRALFVFLFLLLAVHKFKAEGLLAFANAHFFALKVKFQSLSRKNRLCDGRSFGSVTRFFCLCDFGNRDGVVFVFSFYGFDDGNEDVKEESNARNSGGNSKEELFKIYRFTFVQNVFRGDEGRRISVKVEFTDRKGEENARQRGRKKGKNRLCEGECDDKTENGTDDEGRKLGERNEGRNEENDCRHRSTKERYAENKARQEETEQTNERRDDALSNRRIKEETRKSDDVRIKRCVKKEGKEVGIADKRADKTTQKAENTEKEFPRGSPKNEEERAQYGGGDGNDRPKRSHAFVCRGGGVVKGGCVDVFVKPREKIVGDRGVTDSFLARGASPCLACCKSLPRKECRAQNSEKKDG